MLAGVLFNQWKVPYNPWPDRPPTHVDYERELGLNEEDTKKALKVTARSTHLHPWQRNLERIPEQCSRQLEYALEVVRWY